MLEKNQIYIEISKTHKCRQSVVSLLHHTDQKLSLLPQQHGKLVAVYRLPIEGMVWLVRAAVCPLAALYVQLFIGVNHAELHNVLK